MLDIALIREKTDWVKEQIQKLNDENALARIDTIVALDEKRRDIRTRTETAQASRNKLNKAMGKLRGNKKMDEADKATRAIQATTAIEADNYDDASTLMDGTADITPLAEYDLKSAFDNLITELKRVGSKIDEGFQDIKTIETELEENMLWIPNLPHKSVPVFDSEDHNIAHESQGTFREFDFEPKPHWDLGPDLDIIDFEQIGRAHV